MRHSCALAIAGLILISAGACTDDPAPVGDSPTPAPSAAQTAGQTAAASPAPAQTRTVDAGGDILRMSVGPLIRTGDSVVLTVQTTLERASVGRAAVVSRHFSTTGSTSFDLARLVDDARRQVYLVSRTLDGSGCVCTGRAGGAHVERPACQCRPRLRESGRCRLA